MSVRAWRRLYKTLGVLVGLLGVGAVALYFALPTIVRWQVHGVLAKAGYGDAQFTVDRATLFGTTISHLRAGKYGELSLESSNIQYAPLIAMTRRIDDVRIEKAQFLFNLDAVKPEEARDEAASHFDAFTAANAHGLPVWRVALSNCKVIFVRGDARFTVTVDGWLWREEDNRARVSLTMHAGDAPVWLEGDVKFADRTMDLNAGVTDLTLATLLPLLPPEFSKSFNRVDGKVSSNVTVAFIKGHARTRGSLNLSDGAMSSDTLKSELSGANAKIEFQSLNPLRSDPGQAIDVKHFSIGQSGSIDNIHIEIGVTRQQGGPHDQGAQVSIPAALELQKIQFNWGGGEVSSSAPVLVAPKQKSVGFALQFRHVSVNDFLKVASGGKMSGTGAISGDLPIEIAWPRINFGVGQIKSDGPGDLNFGSQVGDLAASVAQREPRLKGQEQQLVAALTHFHYDSISFDFQRNDAGSVVAAHIIGRGTQGLTTPLDLTVRIESLEKLINFYLSNPMRVSSQ